MPETVTVGVKMAVRATVAAAEAAKAMTTADNGGTNGGASGCAALVANQPVEVKLASDSTPLAATEVSQGGDDNEVKVEAPIQMVDVTGMTITALGLVVDVSQANMGGADDDSQDGNSQPIDLTQVMQGQFVEMSLASSQPPLSATEVQVRNFANQVEVEVDDSNGQQVDDMDDNGNPSMTLTSKWTRP